MFQSKVLIVGLKGLGIEIAKNVVLMGVKSVTIADKEKLQLQTYLHNFSSKKQILVRTVLKYQLPNLENSMNVFLLLFIQEISLKILLNNSQ